MKKLQVLLIFLTPLFCYSQITNIETDFQFTPQTLVNTQTNDFFVLDSVISITIPPSNVTLAISYNDYYSNGNIKVHVIYGYFDDVRKIMKKYEYEYDDESRITSLIEYDPNSDTTLIPSEKTITIWFDDDYFSERVNYSYNGAEWNPVTRILSPDHGQPDYFTTFNLNWNTTSSNWDTISKTISYLNEANKVFEVYTYHEIQSEWQITNLRTKEYTNYSQNHISTDYYYYSEFTVGMDEIDIPDIKCYPNPFSSYTTIEYTLNESSYVQISIYNHIGKQVDLIQQNQQSGKQQITWNAEGLPSGVYYFRLQAGDQVASGKMVLVR